MALWSHRCPSVFADSVARKAAIGDNKVWFGVLAFEKMRIVVIKLFKQLTEGVQCVWLTNQAW